MDQASIAQLINEKVTESFSSICDQLVGTITESVTSSVKRSLEGNVASAVKKSKNENRTFSRAFNKDAYEVNNRVTDAIDRAEEALEANNVEEVK